MLFDAFICHASEDKDSFVRPLAEMLRSRHVEVWYDEFTLSVGDGLRRAIDRGLATSRFGIVVLSPSFFAKGWPQWELDGLVAREMDEARRLILPIWYNIGRQQIIAQSPPLADVVAISATRGVTEVCNALLRTIQPSESPLIVARDELVAWGVHPPVISDEWWLDVVEASNRVPAFGAQIPDQSIWGAWSFPLPEAGARVGAERGSRLAWTAMQLAWTTHAEEHRICQITRPEEIHEFLREMPGLYETCLDFPDILGEYAPQLLLREFSGEFQGVFDEMLSKSEAESKRQGAQHGASLTIDGRSPLCDESVALRHGTFGNFRPGVVASHFVRGSMWAPTYDFFKQFDYLVWLVSRQSDWLPEKPRQFLIEGLAGGSTLRTLFMSKRNILSERLERAGSERSFRWTKALKQIWISEVSSSLRKLNIHESSERVGDAILEHGIIDEYFKERRSHRGR